jgi:hypothetical protein
VGGDGIFDGLVAELACDVVDVVLEFFVYPLFDALLVDELDAACTSAWGD